MTAAQVKWDRRYTANERVSQREQGVKESESDSSRVVCDREENGSPHPVVKGRKAARRPGSSVL